MSVLLVDSQKALEFAFRSIENGGLEIEPSDIQTIDPEAALRASGNSVGQMEEQAESQAQAEDDSNSNSLGEDNNAADNGEMPDEDAQALTDEIHGDGSENLGESGSELGNQASRVRNGTEKAGRAMTAAHSARVEAEEAKRAESTTTAHQPTKEEQESAAAAKEVDEAKNAEKSKPVDFSARLNGAEPKRKASRSARTERSVESHARRGVPSDGESAKELIRDFINGKTDSDFVNLMLVNVSVANQVKDLTGVDVFGFAFQLRTDDTRHVYAEHGDPKSEQKAWTEEDFEKLPEVLNTPDRIVPGNRSNQEKYPRLKFEKQLEDGKTYVVEEIAVGWGVMKLVTGWIKENSRKTHTFGTSKTVPSPKEGGNMSSPATRRIVPRPKKKIYLDSPEGFKEDAFKKKYGIQMEQAVEDGLNVFEIKEKRVSNGGSLVYPEKEIATLGRCLQALNTLVDFKDEGFTFPETLRPC